jgi:radical SAM superfamily enzyme YgiQ (UPF0313 family)
MNSRRRVPVYSVYKDDGHSPLALGMIVAFAKSYKGGALDDVYDFIPSPITSAELLREKVWKHGAGIFLCSHYLWSSDHNLSVSKIVKAFFPASLTIHGGPHVPKYDYSCQSFFQKHPYADIAVRGEGELTTAELLEQLAIHPLDTTQTDRRYLSDVPGITYRNGSDVIRTDDRPSVKDLNSFPSPYLTGEFRREDAERWGAAIIETNRGCPYGCTFCDWGSATLSKIRQFAIERIEGEIEWIARSRVGILWIADANFGIFSRDVRIAEAIAACRREYGYPNQVMVNYAKNASERVAEIVRILHSSGVAVDGIISIQTRDPQTLSIIDRSNIKTERYEDLIEIFKRHNLPISSDLMIGLPGSTPESFKADLQFFFDRKVYVKAYSTVLLPNSPMAHRDYIEKYQIKTDSSSRIVSSYSYSPSDLRRMERLYFIYMLTVGFSTLKYLLYYLQVEHHIKAIDFLEAILNQIELNPTSMPQTCRLIYGGLSILSSRESHEWGSFSDEIGGFAVGTYGITDPAMKTVLSVQAKVMPARDRRVPEKLEIEHDFVAYFEGIRTVRNIEEFKDIVPRRLAEYGPGTFEISDPRGLCNIDSNVADGMYDQHRIEWELASALSSTRAPPDLAQDALERVVGADAPPVLFREGVIGQRLLNRRLSKLSGSVKA